MSVEHAPKSSVVDFGMGNLRSVARSLERAGATPTRLTVDPTDVLQADRVVVPGVGACGDAMGALRRHGLDDAIAQRVRSARPLLGICLGLHVLFEHAEEGPTDCLGLIPGKVARFQDCGLSIPHMGWNWVEPAVPHPVVAPGYFYFVHGYKPTDVPEQNVLARTDYGESFCSAAGLDACVAVQFHPEKSQRDGLALLERFLGWAP